MGEDDLIRRGDALRAIDPGHGDFHAGNYNAIAALPVVDKDAAIARLTAELAEARDDAGALLAQLAAAEKYMAKTEAERDALIGAAYEAAAKEADTAQEKNTRQRDTRMFPSIISAETIAEEIRALTPTDATAALDRIKAEAELAGWKRGRDDAAGGFTLHPWSWNGFEIREKIRALTPPADLAARLGGAE